jgi:hypothetical protein
LWKWTAKSAIETTVGDRQAIVVVAEKEDLKTWTFFGSLESKKKGKTLSIATITATRSKRGCKDLEATKSREWAVKGAVETTTGDHQVVVTIAKTKEEFHLQ